jgi:hypothetical protein
LAQLIFLKYVHKACATQAAIVLQRDTGIVNLSFARFTA